MTDTDLRRSLLVALRSWQQAGVTHAPIVAAPIPSTQAAPPAPPQSETTSETQTPVETPAVDEAVPSPTTVAEQSVPDETVASTPPSEPATRAERAAALKVIAKKVSACERCAELATTRTQTVFGVGNPDARVMFIGEAPGADEDLQGEPFVGKAGQLLTKIIEACGWTRDEIYICNILRCRPPGNRTPSREEADNCREYLDAQIATIDPEYIVCWGSCAAQNLLDVTSPIGRMRQKFFTYGRARVLCTYHPSYLLRNPAAKKPVWEDMKLLLSEMGLEPPER